MSERVEGLPAGYETEDQGGDPACWAHLVCPGCGAVETEGHLPDCCYGEVAPGPARADAEPI